MRTHIRRFGIITATVAAFAVLLAGCNVFGGGTGTIKLSLTDAPIDDSSVTGVYINIASIEYQRNGEWVEMTGYDPENSDNPYNLLELTGGESALLGTLNLDAGTYEQIRFILEAPDQGQGPPDNPGSYVEFNEGASTEALFVPSAAQTGYKAESGEAFTVPENGTVELTADFDVRKALVEAGDTYILKPVLRLVVDNQASNISGTVSGISADRYTVLAYEDGTYSDSEATADSDGVRFTGAVTSDTLTDDDSDGSESYTLAYLAAGDYDIYVAQYGPDDNDDGQLDYVSVAPALQDVTVDSEQDTTGENISIGDLNFQ